MRSINFRRFWLISAVIFTASIIYTSFIPRIWVKKIITKFEIHFCYWISKKKTSVISLYKKMYSEPYNRLKMCTSSFVVVCQFFQYLDYLCCLFSTEPNTSFNLTKNFSSKVRIIDIYNPIYFNLCCITRIPFLV